MAKVTENRQVRKTRAALLDAFGRLVLERGYADIRIADVIRQANVGRSTFYEHFRSKDDLLRQIGQAKQPGPEYRQGKSVRHQPNPQKSQIPLLQSHLSDVRREKSEVRKQLEKAQR